MNSRLIKLKATFDASSIDALLITNDSNITYLCEYKSEESWLLVTRKEAVYITDSRYFLDVKNKTKG
ncbi:MAG: aminopeptidase P family N-terminal domain-containing protein, partial [Candidatus Omnitrophica bacterium]|nr:aminopeptidase P family N-terminal domain-containing protein [Candidatus Omnitrophota bacterium]